MEWKSPKKYYKLTNLLKVTAIEPLPIIREFLMALMRFVLRLGKIGGLSKVLHIPMLAKMENIRL
jgi:hypothetical protein